MRAYLCRYGRQSIVDLIGRTPNSIELRLFQEALTELLKEEYDTKDPLTHRED